MYLHILYLHGYSMINCPKVKVEVKGDNPLMINGLKRDRRRNQKGYHLQFTYIFLAFLSEVLFFDLENFLIIHQNLFNNYPHVGNILESFF